MLTYHYCSIILIKIQNKLRIEIPKVLTEIMKMSKKLCEARGMIGGHTYTGIYIPEDRKWIISGNSVQIITAMSEFGREKADYHLPMNNEVSPGQE